MIFAIVAAWLAYRKAKEAGRPPVKWALAAVGVFIGTQFAVALAVSMGVVLAGGAEEEIKSWEMTINVAAIIASFVTTFLLLRYINTPPADGDGNRYINPPPPPPSDF